MCSQPPTVVTGIYTYPTVPILNLVYRKARGDSYYGTKDVCWGQKAGLTYMITNIIKHTYTHTHIPRCPKKYIKEFLEYSSLLLPGDIHKVGTT